MANLDSKQKWHICRIAQEAYEAWAGREQHERTISAGLNGFAAWRHDQQEAAVGVRSLRHCAADDYQTLVDHFHNLRLRHLREAATPEMTFSQ